MSMFMRLIGAARRNPSRNPNKERLGNSEKDFGEVGSARIQACPTCGSAEPEWHRKVIHKTVGKNGGGFWSNISPCPDDFHKSAPDFLALLKTTDRYDTRFIPKSAPHPREADRE